MIRGGQACDTINFLDLEFTSEYFLALLELRFIVLSCLVFRERGSLYFLFHVHRFILGAIEIEILIIHFYAVSRLNTFRDY